MSKTMGLCHSCLTSNVETRDSLCQECFMREKK